MVMVVVGEWGGLLVVVGEGPVQVQHHSQAAGQGVVTSAWVACARHRQAGNTPSGAKQRDKRGRPEDRYHSW